MGLLKQDDWTAKWIGRDEPAPPNELAPAAWIWYPDEDPLKAAPVGARYFRTTIDLPVDKAIQSARALVTADNSAIVYVNGVEIGKISDYHVAGAFDVTSRLRSGKNLVAIKAENFGNEPNTAGLIGLIRVTFTDASEFTAATDAKSWRTARDEQPKWTAVEFDDSAWVQPITLGAFGMAPWGEVGSPTDRRLPARMLRRAVHIEKPLRVYPNSM
jgi:alpha-L-rhamnosidase